MRYAEHSITEDDIAAVVSVLRSGHLTQGPMVERFEAALCEYTGARYAVAVSSGTMALMLAYRACQPAWRITTSPLTFVATASALVWLDGAVRFADVDPETGLLRKELEHDGPVVPVHYAGRVVDVRQWSGRVVIEDACHALGATAPDGTRVGSCAHSLACVFSFHPSKPITTGEGGAVTTNDEGLACALRSLRDHGRADGACVRLGLNARMSDIQAALGLSQLRRCDGLREKRCELACMYYVELEGVDGVSTPFCDVEDIGVGAVRCRHGHHLYPVRIKNGKRDAVRAYLNERGIGAQIHYRPVHLQPYYVERYGYKRGDFPHAEAWGDETLSLPLYAGMSAGDVETVAQTLREALA